MTKQAIIKYIAIIIALILSLSIINLVVSSLLFISEIFNDNNEIDNLKEVEVNSNIRSIDIDISSYNVILRNSDTFYIETNSNKLVFNYEEDELIIEEKTFAKNSTSSDLIIYINDSLKDIDISLGLGSVLLDGIAINDLSVDIGLGKVLVRDTNIKELDLDLGMGSISVELPGELDDYQIKLDKGLGKALLNGDKMQNERVYGNGANFIDIDYGMGSLDIKISDLKSPYLF